MYRYYVYILYRPNGDPFYVGKGTGDRMHRHEKQAALGIHRNKFVSNIICGIKAAGLELQKQVVYQSDDELATLSQESEYIAFIRGLGIELANHTSGGERGKRYTARYKKKLSDAHKLKPIPSAQKSKMQEGRKRYYALHGGSPMSGKKQTAKFRAKMQDVWGKVWSGRKHTAETKLKISKTLTGRKLTAECRKKLSESGKVAWVKRREKMV